MFLACLVVDVQLSVLADHKFLEAAFEDQAGGVMNVVPVNSRA